MTLTPIDNELICTDFFNNWIENNQFRVPYKRNTIDLFDHIPDLLVGTYAGPRFKYHDLPLGVCFRDIASIDSF